MAAKRAGDIGEDAAELAIEGATHPGGSCAATGLASAAGWSAEEAEEPSEGCVCVRRAGGGSGSVSGEGRPRGA